MDALLVKKTTGDKACPFNFLYWNILNDHRDDLQSISALDAAYRELDAIPQGELSRIQALAQQYTENIIACQNSEVA